MKMYKSLLSEIDEASSVEGDSLLFDTNQLIKLFYSEDFPCSEKCKDIEIVQEEVRKGNVKYENLLRVSNRLASLKVYFEEAMLRMSKIDQKLHVEHVFNEIVNPDYESSE